MPERSIPLPIAPIEAQYRLAIIAGQLVVGGAERQLYLWLSQLDRKKFSPVVLTLHPGCGDYWEDSVEALDIPLIRIPRRRNRLLRAWEIIQALRPYQPHLIHGWHLFASPYAGLSAKLLGARSLGSLRGNFQSFSQSTLERNLTLWLTDGILINSASAAEQIQEAWKLRPKRVYTVQNAVKEKLGNRASIRELLSKKFGFSQEKIWIGSLGRLDPGKRFEILLQATAWLVEDGCDFHLILIGDGPERMHLERIAAELGLDQRVRFAGEIPEASQWLSALDIFCFTSLDEGNPNAVMEAAAAGLPIVGWRVGFMEELLKQGEVARLVEPQDLQAFTEALVTLMNSPELRTELGLAARQHVLERFSIPRYVEQMTRVYEDLLAS